eukprot:s5432_g2.t3
MTEVRAISQASVPSLGMPALSVIPTVMWMPGFDQKLQISIKDKEWKSGNVFQQPLNDEGKAEVDIAVLASDRKHKAMYYVSAQGSPLKERGRLFTTLEPPPRSPPTPLPQYRFRSTTPQPQLVPQPPAPPTPQPRSTTERASISTLRPSVAPAVPMSLPLPRWPDGLPLSGIHLPIPELQLSGLLPASAADSAGVAGVLAAGGSVAALLASHELTSFMLLLKELQFLAISHQVAGDSYYALLTEPFRVFLLEIDWPGLEVCVIERWEREERGDAGDAGEGDCKTLPNEKAAEATMVWLAALPLAFLLLALGCVEATWEEQLLRKSQLRGLGLRGLRIKALPLALILLDVGLLGLTNSSKVFLPNMAVKVSIFGPGRLWISGVLSTLTLRWLCWGVALGFCGFGSAQLLRLQLSGLLCWSPKLAKFADSSTLAVTLRDSAYPRPAATAWAAMAEACDGFTELRAAVPICGPERQVLCLTDDRFSWQHKSSKRQSRKGAYEGCLFAVLPPEEALLARESIFTGSSTSRSARDLREIAKASCQEQEAGGDPHRRKLLAEGSGAAAWQLQREHLGLLIWLERRCDAYDALKVQISEATGHGVITDAEGWPIYDCQGQPLRDLYQYCIYQFPWRPWLRTLAGRNPGCSLTGAREPYRKGTGVLAPWVPSVAGVQELERQQINDWLSEWLVESEAASAAREELRQLRWCAQELQHAVLMEMALAVLERRSFRAPSGTPREAARASQRLDKLVTTPQPWQQQVDGLGSHEILAFLHEELLDSDDMPFYDEELVPDFLDASFGVLRFHVRGCGENPNPGAPPELPRRPPIRVSESLSPRRPPAARVQHAVRRLQVRENMVTVKLPLKHLEIMVRWLPSFGFAVPSKNVALPLSERWRPLFVSFGSCPKCRDCPAAAGAGTGSDNLRISSPFLALQVDSLDRLFSLLCVFLLDGEGYKGLLGLLLWPLLSALLRLRCRGSGSLGISASYAQEVTLGRRDPHWNPHSGFPAFPNMPWLPWLQLLLGLSLFLRKVTGLSKAMDVLTSLLLLYQSFLRCLLPAARLFLWKILKRRPILRGWRLHLAEEWNKQAALIVLGISSNDHPYPDYGIVQAVDKGFAGEAPNLLFVVRMLGLQLWGMQTSEVGGAPGQEAPSTNQRRLQGLRKLFILFEPCPPGLTDARPRPAPASGQGEVLDSVRQSLRFKEEIRDPIPVATTREQVVGVEELPQVVATIQVVNHLGRHWASSNRHDSFFSLFLPWGLDSRRPTATSQPRGSHDGRGQWKHWRNETFESTKLVATWQSQVLQFLDEELAAGSLVAHGILDLLFFAGNPGRGAFEEEVDKLLVPGIFTDDCLGTKRFCDSRCFREGRILHYVIASKDLKPGRRAWRPDPLAAHAASLFLSSNSSSASLPSASESDPGSLEGLNFWRPCLLRLNSRQVSYVLQKGEEEAEEAAAAAMAAGAIDHGDALEYRIPFVFLDRIEVSRGLRGHEDDECLLTFHGVASTPSSSSIATEPEAVAAGEPEECGNPLQLTPGPLRAERASPRGSPRVSPRASLPATAPSLPLVFRVGKEDGEVWAKVIEEYGMFTPPLHIFHYIGDVRDHPRLPGVVYRHGEGDQLWPDGTRYFGQWEEHVYHGTGQLQDPEGQVIYKGQWAHGMKHGEGFYRFFQEPSGSRAYSGHFQREEFSGRGILWVVEEDGSLEWVQKHRPWAITRYEGKFSGGSEVREPRSLILVDERDGVALHEYFPVLQNEAGVGPHQGPGKAPKDLAAETYGLDAADLQHCGPDADAEIWYADGTRYHGPCLPGAVPHGEGGTLWEEAGLCFEGTFDRGLRAPKGRASLPNGVIYEGDFSQPGGRANLAALMSCLPHFLAPSELTAWRSLTMNMEVTGGVGAAGRLLSACAGSVVRPSARPDTRLLRVRMQAQASQAPSRFFVCGNGITDHTFDMRCHHWRHLLSVQRPSMRPSMLSTLRSIYREAGVKGLYAGLPVTMVIAVPANVLYFATYESMRDYIIARQRDTERSAEAGPAGPGRTPAGRGCKGALLCSGVLAPLIAGGFGRAVAVSACAPLEEILRHEGWRALFRGLESTLWRDVPFSAFYWLGVEAVRDALLARGVLRDSNYRSPLVALAASSCAGAAAAFVTTPFDVVKTRRQVQAARSQRSLWKDMVQLARSEGVGSLFTGSTPRVVRVAPACSIMLGTRPWLWRRDLLNSHLRHGSGTTSIPEALQRRLGFRSYVGHYLHGLRHGQGEAAKAGSRDRYRRVRKQTCQKSSCEVLLHVLGSSVNPADRTAAGPFPQVLGSDVVAVVEAVEPSCGRLAVGDRVWADIGAVVQTSSGKGKENGAFAPFAVALESQLGRMPKKLSVWEAAALPKVSLTSYKALKWYGGAPYGRDVTVLILGGSGGCGSTGIQLAKAWGATTIITTTSVANEPYVLRLGADRVIDYRSQNWWEVLSNGTVDVVYDTVGEAGTGDRAMSLMRRGAQLCTWAVMRGYFVTIAGALPQKPRADIRSSTFINSATNLQNFQLLDELRDLVDAGHLRMPEIQTFELADILAAFDVSAAHHSFSPDRIAPSISFLEASQLPASSGLERSRVLIAPWQMIFTDGTVYRGKFEKNRRHGHGHYRTQDGTPIYTGPWKNDEPGTGYADILYPSGHRYKGKVCDGCRDGKGSLWHQDSDGDSTFLYCGHWEADEMHGEGELHCSDGVYRGQFVNGLREGKGRFEYARSKDTLSYYEGEWEEDQPQGIGTFVDEHGQEFCDREFEQGDLVGNRLTGRSKRIFSVKTISSVSLSLSKQKPSSSKVLPGPKKEIPHAGTVCQNAGLLPEEEPAQTRVIDVGSGVSNARSRPAHCGPEDSMGLRWA